MRKVIDSLYWLRFVVYSFGWTEAGIEKVWLELVEKDIDPAEPWVTPWLSLSAKGSSLHVKYIHEGWEFTINYSDQSGLYFHERDFAGQWQLVYNQKHHVMKFLARWIRALKLISGMQCLIGDRSGENTRYVKLRLENPGQ